MAFSQGFAVGFGARSQLRNEKLQEEQEFVAKNDAVAQNLIKNAAEIAKQAAIVGKPVDLEEFRIRYQGLIESASVARARRFNTDPDTILAQQDARLAQFESAIAAAAASPGPEDVGAAAGRQEVAGATAIAGGLTEAGAPTTVGEAATAAGLVPEPTAAPRPSVANFRMPDGSIQAVNINDTAKLNQIINSGGVKISLSVQSPGLEGIGATSGVTKKEREAVKGSIQGLNADIEEVNETLRQFEESPEAGGVLGVLIEKGGGLLQQLPGGDRALDIVGVDPAEVKAVRSNARTTASRMLSTITGEEGNRFTDTERKIAEEALATLDPTSSTEQISAALTQALNLLGRAEGRQMVRFLQASGADLTTQEGQIAFTQVLIDNGFTQERAIDAMLNLQERLGFE